MYLVRFCWCVLIKQASRTIVEIELTIQNILNIGKIKYLKQDGNKFRRIVHDYSNNEKGFIK